MSNGKERISENYKTELLAPAGSPEAAVAAFTYGADAVYLGLKKFSARAQAENFDFTELSEIIGYAHSLQPRRKVYVTLNTLLQNSELNDVARILAQLSLSEVDALIVQDLGIVKMVKTSFPELELHASTQMAIHNIEGALSAKEMGFSRVVLARELSWPEIKKITTEAGIEVEVFIHGALCYSYSGLCLFSSHCFGMSGNRGKCLYPCRDSYRIGDDSFLPFSMKDLALPHMLNDFQKAGVASLKIEGRKKSPLYVAAVTDYYRCLLDGTAEPEEIREKEENLRSIFSRPSCEFGIRTKPAGNVIDPKWTGHRGVPIGQVERMVVKKGNAYLVFTTSRNLELHDGLQLDLPTQSKPYGFAVNSLIKIDKDKQRSLVRAEKGSQVMIPLPDHYPQIPLGTVVYCGSSQEVKNRFKFEMPRLKQCAAKIPLDIKVVLTKSKLEVFADCAVGKEIVRRDIALEPAKNVFEAESAFKKLGDTDFSLRNFELDNPFNLFVPLSLLNEMRREITAILENKLQQFIESEAKAAIETVTADADKQIKWIIKSDSFSIIQAATEFPGVEEFIFEINPQFNATKEVFTLAADVKSHLRFALPMILRKSDIPEIEKVVTTLASSGFVKWEVANLAHLTILKNAYHSRKRTLDLSSSWSLYALNQKAVEELAEMGINNITLSPEDDRENIKSLTKIFPNKLSLIVYQATPLFTSAACPYAACYGCPGKDKCDYKTLKLTSKNGEFIAFNKGCSTLVCTEKDFSLAGYLSDFRQSGGINFKLEFINKPYKIEECKEIFEKLKGDLKINNTHTGNFERGLN